mgnify:CR=1 FL=1
MARAGKTTKRSAPRPPGAEHRFVVLAGKEIFLRDHYTRSLRDALESEFGQTETFRFDGERATPAEVLDECRSFGLMAPHKMVVVDSAESFVHAESRPMLERYAHNPSDQATLVLRAGSWRAGNLDKAINSIGVVIKCDALDEGRAAQWAAGRATQYYGVDLTPATANHIVGRLGPDLGRLDTELSKLATAAGAGGAITDALVAELVGHTREQEVWAIQRHLLAGDAARTIAELRVILGNAPRDNSVPAIFACTDLARKLVGATEGLRQGMHPAQLGKTLKIWGEAQDQILGTARAISPAVARRLLDLCVETDRLSKSSNMNPTIALERLSVAFASVSRR